MLEEANIRLIVKGVTWRFFGTAATIIIVYICFGILDLAIKVGIFETATKIVLYWGHEKIWQRIRWGKHYKT